jgi:hypothetical protein
MMGEGRIGEDVVKRDEGKSDSFVRETKNN